MTRAEVAALKAANAKLEAHFTVQPGDHGVWHDKRLQYVVYSNGEMKPEAVQSRHMTNSVRAIEDTVDAVIRDHPNGGIMWVRKPLELTKWDDKPADKWGEAYPAGVAARIRFVVEDEK